MKILNEKISILLFCKEIDFWTGQDIQKILKIYIKFMYS